jgi:hypothetical protein
MPCLRLGEAVRRREFATLPGGFSSGVALRLFNVNCQLRRRPMCRISRPLIRLVKLIAMFSSGTRRGPKLQP